MEESPSRTPGTPARCPVAIRPVPRVDEGGNVTPLSRRQATSTASTCSCGKWERLRALRAAPLLQAAGCPLKTRVRGPTAARIDARGARRVPRPRCSRGSVRSRWRRSLLLRGGADHSSPRPPFSQARRGERERVQPAHREHRFHGLVNTPFLTRSVGVGRRAPTALHSEASRSSQATRGQRDLTLPPSRLREGGPGGRSHPPPAPVNAP